MPAAAAASLESATKRCMAWLVNKCKTSQCRIAFRKAIWLASAAVAAEASNRVTRPVSQSSAHAQPVAIGRFHVSIVRFPFSCQLNRPRVATRHAGLLRLRINCKRGQTVFSNRASDLPEAAAGEHFNVLLAGAIHADDSAGIIGREI